MSVSLEPECNGEVEAINKSLQQLCHFIKIGHYAIQIGQSSNLKNLRSALQHIKAAYTCDSKVREIHHSMNMLQNLGKQITFQKIPSHKGIEGNESADILAKKSTKIKQLRSKA